MTQFDNPYANPYVDPVGQQPKTSGLAVTALVFSVQWARRPVAV